MPEGNICQVFVVYSNTLGDIRDVILLNSVIPARASRAVCHGMTPLNSMIGCPFYFYQLQTRETDLELTAT